MSGSGPGRGSGSGGWSPRGRRRRSWACGPRERALEVAGLEPEAVDLIIAATSTPDTVFPATAVRIQKELGARRAAGYDLSAACSGFVYALHQARYLVEAGAARHVLVVGVDLLSRITDWTDRSTCVLFGDGAGAVVVAPVAEGRASWPAGWAPMGRAAPTSTWTRPTLATPWGDARRSPSPSSG